MITITTMTRAAVEAGGLNSEASKGDLEGYQQTVYHDGGNLHSGARSESERCS